MTVMRVLVVGSDPCGSLVVRTTIEELGYAVTRAASGEEALRVFLVGQHHVVIVDAVLPGMDGEALCCAIRSSLLGHSAYIMVIAGEGEEARARGLQAVEAGADDLLGKPLDPFQVQVRMQVAARVHRVREELRVSRDELKALADTDPLTGVYNRRRLESDLARLHAVAVRYARPYAVALVDVDGFKEYNDSNGHLAGDAALTMVTSVFQAECRAVDSVYRYGGDEFVILFSDSDVAGALTAVERIRAGVVRLAGDIAAPLTISAGVAGFDGDRDLNVDAILSAADAALYSAKARGRNRVVLAPPQ